MTSSREIVSGSLFVVGVVGVLALLLASGADLSAFGNGPWPAYVLPFVVALVFWAALIPDRELHRLTRWPFLFRYPLEIAGVVLLLWLAYIIGAGGVDRRSWGILGGIAAALSVAFRGRTEAESRGESLDQSLGAISSFVLARRWRSANLSGWLR